MVQPSPTRPMPQHPLASDPSPARRRPGLWRVVATAAAIGLVGLSAGAGLGGCEAEPTPFHENRVGVLPQDSLSRAWFVDLKLDGPDQQVVTLDVRSKLLYVYTADKHVTAIDRKTGVVRFTMAVDSPEPRLQPLVELEGYIVFPNATNLQVFDDQGQFLKSIPVPTPIRSNAAAESSEVPGTNHGTTVYFGASGIGHGGLVEAYDVSRTSAFQKWEYITHAQGAIVAAPAVYGDIVYTGDDQGEVDAVSTIRVQVWGTPGGYFLTSGAITADLRTDESGLYVASNDSKLYCLNRNTGKLKWQYFAAAPLVSSPVLTPDTVYLPTTNRGLVALDKNTGAYNRAPRWTAPLADQFLAQDAKFTYVEETRPNPARPGVPFRVIVALDKQTGRKAFESDHNDFTCLGINPRDAMLYVSFADGKLMALQPVLQAGQIGELVQGRSADLPPVAMAR